MKNVYEELRQRLDDMSTGYPETKSRVEIKILKNLFTEDEARLFLQLSPMLETPDQIGERLNQDIEKLSEQMEIMAKKGLLFRKRKEGVVKYATVPFVIGILEHQVKRINAEYAKDMDLYFNEAFGKAIHKHKTPLMRTIPVNKEIASKWPIAPYEDVLDIIDSQKKITVSDCICRKSAGLIQDRCDSPLEACFSFGSAADYFVENNIGRYVDAKEAKEIIKKNLEKAPLVMQPTNSQRAGALCMCCGDCCGMLKSLKLQPDPASSVKSNYYAKIDESLCSGCEICIDRCQMEAIKLEDEIAVIQKRRCIGCGLCVSTCPTEAVSLEKKEETYVPPKSMIDTFITIAHERGKI